MIVYRLCLDLVQLKVGTVVSDTIKADYSVQQIPLTKKLKGTTNTKQLYVIPNSKINKSGMESIVKTL